MPYEGPGERRSQIATKATSHGSPAEEKGFAGIAAKSAQAAPAAVSVANATAARQIAVGEEFVLMLHGVHEVAAANLPNGAIEGDPLWIDRASNALVLDGQAGNDEVEVVTLASATGGTFRLTFAGQQTAALAYNASAAAVQAALEALSNIAPGDVSVTGSAGGPYTILFTGSYAREDVTAITADGTALTGSSPTITVTTPTAGTAEGRVKFGRIDSIDSTLGRALVNLTQRSSF